MQYLTLSSVFVALLSFANAAPTSDNLAARDQTCAPYQFYFDEGGFLLNNPSCCCIDQTCHIIGGGVYRVAQTFGATLPTTEEARDSWKTVSDSSYGDPMYGVVRVDGTCEPINGKNTIPTDDGEQVVDPEA